MIAALSWINLCCRGWPGHCHILDFHLPHPPCGNKKCFLVIADCPLGGEITPSWEPLSYSKKNEYLFCISDYVRYRLHVLCNPEHYLLKSYFLFKDWEPEGRQGWCGGGGFIFLFFGSFFIFQYPTMKMHYNQRNSQWLLLIFALIIPRPVFSFSIVYLSLTLKLLP